MTHQSVEGSTAAAAADLVRLRRDRGAVGPGSRTSAAQSRAPARVEPSAPAARAAVPGACRDRPPFEAACAQQALWLEAMKAASSSRACPVSGR